MTLAGILKCDLIGAKMEFHVTHDVLTAINQHESYILMLASMGSVVPKVSRAFKTGDRVDYNENGFYRVSLEIQ